MLGKNVQIFCCENISLVENYEKAANDLEMWDCHHRLETDLGLSVNELKEQGKYFNVPASELIFLTHGEHSRLHNNTRFKDPKERQKQSEKNRGEKNPMYGKTQSNESNEKRSQSLKGKLKDCPWMNNGIIRVRPKNQEEIEYYLEQGYVFGMKLK